MPPLAPGKRLQILGTVYDVDDISGDEITLQAPLDASPTTASEALHQMQPDTVWLFLECRAEEPNPDMQLLLYNMDAHLAVQRLIRQPVSLAPTPAELPHREVLLGCCRLLKALCSGFKVTQVALLPEVAHLVSMTDLRLVAHDISPTDTLIAILKDNPQGCLQVGDDLIRKFMALAAETKAPRFLRFLRNITGPERQPLIRTQTLVMQALADHPAAQLLFNSAAGKAERRAMIRSNDLIIRPRGKLAYHVELISLVARCTEGIAPSPEAIARSLFSLGDLLEHLLLPELPTALRTQYLHVLDEAYLYVKRSVKDLASSAEMVRLVEFLADQVHEFATGTLTTLGPDYDEQADEVQAVMYVFTTVFPTMSLFLDRHYLPGRVSDDMAAAAERFGREVVDMNTFLIDSDDWAIEDRLPLSFLVRVMRALTSRELIDVDDEQITTHRVVTFKTLGKAVAAQNRIQKGVVSRTSLARLEDLATTAAAAAATRGGLGLVVELREERID